MPRPSTRPLAKRSYTGPRLLKAINLYLLDGDDEPITAEELDLAYRRVPLVYRRKPKRPASQFDVTRYEES